MLYTLHFYSCLLYTSDAADERSSVDLGGSRIIKKNKQKKKKENNKKKKQNSTNNSQKYIRTSMSYVTHELKMPSC